MNKSSEASQHVSAQRAAELDRHHSGFWIDLCINALPFAGTSFGGWQRARVSDHCRPT